MIIAPVAAPAATASAGVSPPGAEGFEETMAAILGLAAQAPAQPPTLPALPATAAATTASPPAEGLPVAMPTVPPQSGPVAVPSPQAQGLPEATPIVPPQTHPEAAPDVEARVEAPAAPATATPPLPHPGVRFPERRGAQHVSGGSTMPIADKATVTADLPAPPSVAGDDPHPTPPAAETALPAAAEQATMVSTGSAAVATATAGVRPSASSPPVTVQGSVGPVDAPGRRATGHGSEGIQQPAEPATGPTAERAVSEDPPTVQDDRRTSDAASTSVVHRSETPVMTGQAPLAHVIGPAADGDAPVTSALLQRVEDVVRRLENAPPPRSITLAIDDQGLTRVTVSVLSDGVRLTVPEGSQTPTGLVGQLERALESRGFDLSQHGRQRRPQEEPDAPWAPTTSPQRRSQADTAVRF